MTAVSVTAIASVAAGIGIGVLIGRRRGEGTARRPGHGAGMTVSQMLQRTVSLAPVGVVVVDTLRDVVVANDRAVELGLVRERLLDDRVWAAAQRTLATGEDVEVDLSAPRGVAQPASNMASTAMRAGKWLFRGGQPIRRSFPSIPQR